MTDLHYPFTEAAVRELRAGQIVRVSGLVFTGRDRLHKHLASGGDCPVSLRDGALYHCGPVTIREADGSWRVVAAGPTTSVREEPYMAEVIARHGVRVIIGKGGMGERTRQACAACGCVYLQAAGGAAALLAQRVRRVEGVHFYEAFGAAEALWLFDVCNFEAVVAMDALGQSLFDSVQADSRLKLAGLLAPR